jgi:hypothetical protein
MQRLVLAMAGLLVCATAGQAQTTTVPSYIVNAGATVNVTVTGAPGQHYAVIGSTMGSGFSYEGVPLQVGGDVIILANGVLNATGQAVVAVTPFPVPPFPARDRYYVQGVLGTSPNFVPPSPLNGVTLVNADAARVFMPIGGIVNANGTPAFVTSGVSVSRIGVGVYQINHAGFFAIPTAIPTITPTEGAIVTAISTNANVTTISLSADAIFFFTIQSIRR